MRIGAENAGGAPNLSVSRRLAMSKACNFSYALIVITGLSARLDDTQGPGVNLGQVPREEGLSAPRNTFSSRAAPAAINGSQLDFQFFAGQHLSDGKERGRAFEDMLRRYFLLARVTGIPTITPLSGHSRRCSGIEINRAKCSYPN